MQPIPTVAYLAEGKLYIKAGDQPPRLVESDFVQQILDRVSRSRQRNDWKQGMAWDFSGQGMMPFRQDDPGGETRRFAFTGITRGTSGELLYALDTDYVGGLFAYEMAGGYERRIFHRNGFRARDLCRHLSHGLLAMSLLHNDGTASIATMEAAGRGLREVTEGDSVDEAPAWAEGDGKALVFQSAGVGRNARGAAVARSPYVIQKLDLDGEKLQTLVEIDGCDCLVPRLLADGTLLYIRRPYESHAPAVSPVKVLLDIVLFPFRLVRAIVHFLNVFSMIFSRKPLLTAGGPPREPVESRYMMLWGKVIDAEKAIKKARHGQTPALVPDSWRLIRRLPDGTEQEMAKGVLAYDVCGMDIVYTDGSRVWRLDMTADGTGAATTVCSGHMIERVLGVPDTATAVHVPSPATA